MASKEINPMPPTKNGENHLPTDKKGLEAFQRAMTQKSFKYSHQGGVKIDELTLKTWKGEGNDKKKKPLGKTSREDAKSHLDVP
jgi:hypothetical protein